MNQNSIHASCVVIGSQGIIIRGASGSGKSDLVLRLIDGYDATLVADDQVILNLKDGGLFASPPKSLAGKFEIRGQGIVDMAYCTEIRIAAVIDLVPLENIERMPDPDHLKTTLEQVELPCLKLHAWLPSAPARIRAFLKTNAANSF